MASARLTCGAAVLEIGLAFLIKASKEVLWTVALGELMSFALRKASKLLACCFDEGRCLTLLSFTKLSKLFGAAAVAAGAEKRIDLKRTERSTITSPVDQGPIKVAVGPSFTLSIP